MMTVDVSLVLQGAGDRADVLGQTLSNLEIVDRLGDASGTWVMLAADERLLSRHAVKNLLLAAERHKASMAIGGGINGVEPLDDNQFRAQYEQLDFNGVLLNREWLQTQAGLIQELEQGARVISTESLAEIDAAVLIPQRTFEQPIAKVIDASLATIQAAPIGRASAIAFAFARLLPLSRTVLFDVDGDRPTDAAIDFLARQWKSQYKDIRQVHVAQAMRGNWRHAWQLGRARWLVTNELFMTRLPKRKAQTMVVAAGEFPLVRSGRDNPDWVLQPTSQRRPSWSQIQRWDLVVTSSAFATQVLRTSTGYVGRVLEGESLLADELSIDLDSSAVRERLGVKPDLPVVLCALHSSAARVEVGALASLFEGRAHFQFGPHDWAAWSAIADLMITDWSAAAMEFAGLQRPIIGFQVDQLDVVRRRGTYVNLAQELPGPICSSAAELTQCLHGWLAQGDQSIPEFSERSEAFSLLGSRSTGQASSRIWDAMVSAR